jgi:hypothetical protein
MMDGTIAPLKVAVCDACCITGSAPSCQIARTSAQSLSPGAEDALLDGELYFALLPCCACVCAGHPVLWPA